MQITNKHKKHTNILNILPINRIQAKKDMFQNIEKKLSQISTTRIVTK